MRLVRIVSPIKAAPCVIHVRQSSAVSPADCPPFSHLGGQRPQWAAALQCFTPVEAASSDSPALLVPLLSTVGVNHPAQVWAPQGPGRVQQRLHQRRRAAVHAHGQQLQGPAGHLHGVCEEAAVWNAPPVLCRASRSVWSKWIRTLDCDLFLTNSLTTLQEKESQAAVLGNSVSSSVTACASLILGIVSKARRSAPAAAKHSTCGRCQSFSSSQGKKEHKDGEVQGNAVTHWTPEYRYYNPIVTPTLTWPYE